MLAQIVKLYFQTLGNYPNSSDVLIVMASIHQYEYRDFIYKFLSILFELLGQSISILFTELALIFSLDSIG